MAASEERWDVVGVGANSVDFVNLLPGYPQPFGAFAKMRIRDRRVLCGGQTATAMCTCASLGLRSKYVGVSGTDENGRRIRAELTRREVDITDLIIRDAENQFAVILVDETTGERIVLWDRDDRLRLRERELPVGAVTHAMFAQHVPTRLTGTTDMEQALRILRKRHNQVLCVTLGEHGAMVLDGDRLYQEPAFSVQAVDTTGAGDVFRGGFIYALVHGQPMDQALRTANAAAAVSCTRLGALNGVPSLDEVDALIASRKVRV
jgi:sulfofructose kinase